MKESIMEKMKFALRVIFIHSVSYILCGLVLHQVFDYGSIFDAAVIGNYMRPVSDPLTMIGPWLQPVRGLLFAGGLWLLRPAWKERKTGWLVIWAVIFIFGILNTPAAAPSSIEGLLYSRLPVWYHLMGCVEVGLQTLVFSVFVFVLERKAEGGRDFWARHPRLAAVVRAVALSCLAYIGYAAGSIALLLLGGGTLEFRETAVRIGTGDQIVNIEEAAGDPVTQFMFASMFAVNAIFILVHTAFLNKKRIAAPLLAAIAMAVNIAGLAFYQALFNRLMPVPALLFIALLPALVITVCLKKDVFALKEKKEKGANRGENDQPAP